MTATVDPGQPHRGLVEVSLGRTRLARAGLLGIAVGRFPGDDQTPTVEHYARGPDLVTSYKESPHRPVCIDARWRAASATASEKFTVALELVVSARTQLSDSRAELAVQSRLPASETLRLVDAESAGYHRLAPSPRAATVVQPLDGPGCVVFRLPSVPLSYAEMVHPVDFQHDELWGSPEDDPTVRLAHRLFTEPFDAGRPHEAGAHGSVGGTGPPRAQRLEKGVILRARVRGIWLPRNRDTQVAAECYNDFAAAEPPLSA